MSNFSTIEILLRVSFSILIYPGFLFLAILAVVVEGLRRNFKNWAEGRDSPSLLQPLYDWRKLWGKTTVVSGAGFVKPDQTAEEIYLAETKAGIGRIALFFLPGMALIALVLAATLLPIPGSLWPFRAEGEIVRPLGADLVAVSLLLLLPSVVCILLGSLGGSIYSQLAGSRTAQLFIGFLAPYAVAIFGPAVVLNTLDMQTMVGVNSNGAIAVKLICGLIFLVAIPAGLRIRPLVLSSGEGLEGLTTDLSGPPLALFRIMEAVERVVSGLLFAVLFVPLSGNPLIFIGAFLLYLGILAVIETLFGQFKLKDALRFYIMYASPGALLWFVVLALVVKV